MGGVIMKRKYTYAQELLPEIKAMVSEGRGQREKAEPADIVAEQAYKSKRLKWKMTCCGIFCGSQKGGESSGIPYRPCVNSLECPRADMMVSASELAIRNRMRS